LFALARKKECALAEGFIGDLLDKGLKYAEAIAKINMKKSGAKSV